MSVTPVLPGPMDLPIRGQLQEHCWGGLALGGHLEPGSWQPVPDMLLKSSSLRPVVPGSAAHRAWPALLELWSVKMTLKRTGSQTIPEELGKVWAQDVGWKLGNDTGTDEMLRWGQMQLPTSVPQFSCWHQELCSSWGVERAEGKAAWIPNKTLQAGSGQVETSQYVHEANPSREEDDDGPCCLNFAESHIPPLTSLPESPELAFLLYTPWAGSESGFWEQVEGWSSLQYLQEGAYLD